MTTNAIATFARPCGEVGLEVVAHPAGDLVELFAMRLGVRHGIAIHPEEIATLIDALEEAEAVIAGAARSRVQS